MRSISFKLISFALFVLIYGNINAIDYEAIKKRVDKTPRSVTNSTEKLSAYLCKPYKSKKEKLASIYYWVAKNITYNDAMAKKPIYYEKVDEIVDYVIKKKSGVCQHYSELVARLGEHAGLTVFVVNGYTRTDKRIDELSHAWNIAKIGSNWYFLDATWAGASLKTVSKGKFPIGHFLLTPENNIKERMPFDPMWQALSKLVKYPDFDKGKVAVKSGNFNYNDTIIQHNKLGQLEKHQAIIRRMNNNGAQNYHVKKEVSLMQNNYKMLLHNIEVEKYNEGSNHYNKGMKAFNQYVTIKNNRKNYMAKSRTELMLMINNCLDNLDKAEAAFAKVQTENTEMKSFLKKNKTNIKKVRETLNKEKEFVNTNFK